ncbi:hypothetical protein AVEN_264072-1 [Araneus ventricosus]|uniref:Uncharacterized protein n=1 Tax=Araneus ventricosus TaxID=182803 RepID=A0A4Y2MZB0_ARAVE|nr:hypothetical protein AVEN_264072-1 [Araneus ventricosus]
MSSCRMNTQELASPVVIEMVRLWVPPPSDITYLLREGSARGPVVTNFPTKVREVSPLNPVRAWPDGGGPSFDLYLFLPVSCCCERERSVLSATLPL